MISITSYSQTKVDSIKVYKYFLTRGYTTSGAYTYFKDLDSMQIEKLNLTKSQVDSLNAILINAKRKKHFQQKYGIENAFMIFYIQGLAHKVVFNIDSRVVDLKDKMEYVINFPLHRDYLRKLLNDCNSEKVNFFND
jgi:hypothetical protein